MKADRTSDATPRTTLTDRFLDRHGWGGAVRTDLAGDASFRRYDRLVQDGRRAVLMDAPPPREDVRPFIAITAALEARSLSAPSVLARDAQAGFLLLEDLGDDRFSRVINHAPDLERPLYEAAVDCLAALHAEPPPDRIRTEDISYDVPVYDMARYLEETALFVDWYLPAMRGGPVPVAERSRFLTLFERALRPVADDRSALVLRDYHADNLMWLPDREDVARVGLLDYQDAVLGHPAYDLVSLLEDARRDVPPELAAAMTDRYLAARPDIDRDRFQAAAAILAAQRNTKIIGIFTRLMARDRKSVYLDLIPRVWGLLERDLAHPALTELRGWFDAAVPPHMRGRAPTEEALWRLPDAAMILAAGLGTRMRPLTLTTPKPLIKVAGKAMIDHSLDRLATAGVGRAVVNIHHLPDAMRDHMHARSGRLPDVTLSDEVGELLDSGGGVAKALPDLGGAPFFVLNSDMVWDTQTPEGVAADCFFRLAAAWNGAAMDALLLVVPTSEAMGHKGSGDFFVEGDTVGPLIRRGEASSAPYTFIGIQIISPTLFKDAPAGAFSLNRVYDDALQRGRLFGLVHEGRWMHVGTPDVIDDASRLFGANMFGET